MSSKTWLIVAAIAIAAVVVSTALAICYHVRHNNKTNKNRSEFRTSSSSGSVTKYSVFDEESGTTQTDSRNRLQIWLRSLRAAYRYIRPTPLRPISLIHRIMWVRERTCHNQDVPGRKDFQQLAVPSSPKVTKYTETAGDTEHLVETADAIRYNAAQNQRERTPRRGREHVEVEMKSRPESMPRAHEKAETPERCQSWDISVPSLAELGLERDLREILRSTDRRLGHGSRYPSTKLPAFPDGTLQSRGIRRDRRFGYRVDDFRGGPRSDASIAETITPPRYTLIDGSGHTSVQLSQCASPTPRRQKSLPQQRLYTQTYAQRRSFGRAPHTGSPLAQNFPVPYCSRPSYDLHPEMRWSRDYHGRFRQRPKSVRPDWRARRDTAASDPMDKYVQNCRKQIILDF